MRKTPRYSHASLGYAEQANWTVEAVVRTFCSSLAQHLRELRPDEPFMAWVIRHAGFVVTKFRVLETGKTAHSTLTGRPYRGEMLELGEVCLRRDPTDVASVHKADSRWELAIWAGKVEESDEHVVLHGAGLDKVRVVRRRPEDGADAGGAVSLPFPVGARAGRGEAGGGAAHRAPGPDGGAAPP